MTKKILSAILSLIMISASMLCTSAASKTLLGDVDRDGKITSSDARTVLRVSVGLDMDKVFDGFMYIADVEKDGKVDASDARKVLRMSVGLDDLIECDHSFGEWTATEDGTAHSRKCIYCGITEKGEHDFELQEQQPGTCTQTGIALEICRDCGAHGALKSTSTNHAWEVVEGSEIPATCYEDGFRRRICTNCHEESDEILPKGHIKSAEPTCTQASTCDRCGIILEEALGHTYKRSASVTITTGITCDRCGGTAVPSFNELVNVLKDDNHTVAGVAKSVTDFSEPKFSGLMEIAKPLFEKEFKDMIGKTTEYSDKFTSMRINKYNFNIEGTPYVSLLSDSDVQSVKTTYINGLDFVKQFPDSVVNSDNDTIDLTEFKNKKYGELMKVTVTVNPEVYADVADKGGSVTIDKIYSGYGAMLNETIGSFDLGMDDFMRIECDCTSYATVSFYFDSKTLDPVAAEYAIKMDIDQAMNIYMTDNGDKTTKPTGSVKFDMINDVYSYYFFENVG